MAEKPKIAVIIVAGGRGVRATASSSDNTAKQYRVLAGQSVIACSLSAFMMHEAISLVQPVIAATDDKQFDASLSSLSFDGSKAAIAPAVHGGATRQASVMAGLEALAAQDFHGVVMIHDAARPFVNAALIDRAVAAGMAGEAAIPVLPITDTLKTMDSDGIMTGTLPRDGLVNVQTPQVFDFDILLAAHRKAKTIKEHTSTGFTDDAAVMEWAGIKVFSFAGDVANVKLTHPEDFEAAEARLAQQLVTRIGQGYDVHRFMAGDHVWIGGIRIAHDQGVEAHSDGDVVLHALTDAILGALAEGDIGVHFSPNDPRWRGASSDQFLRFAAERVGSRLGRIDHLDTTLVCEQPRLGPYREDMRARIAAICGVSIAQVSIKATTSEQMGFTGRREGLSASAVATLSLPRENG